MAKQIEQTKKSPYVNSKVNGKQKKITTTNMKEKC